jgi:zinc transporter ZupT
MTEVLHSESRFWIALAAALTAALVTGLGIYFIRHFERWALDNGTYFVCAAAGVLIGAAFLHLIPESFGLNRLAPAFLLGGFVTLHVIDRFITVFVCRRDPNRAAALGFVPLIGIGLHSFVDGAVYSITFSVSVFTGVLAGVGMVLHEFPEGVLTYVLLIRSGFSKPSALRWAILAAALSTPLGMLASYPLVSRIGDRTLGALLAVSAGALVYVGASHLLPRAEEEPKRGSVLAFIGGIGLAVTLVLAGA